MKNFRFVLLFFAIGTVFFAAYQALSALRSVQSKVIISDHIMEFFEKFEELRGKGKGKTLLALDVDDTLYQSAGLLGTPNWFYSMVNVLRENHVSKKNAYKVLSKLDYYIQEHVPIKMVEPNIIDSIKDIQTNNNIVIAITSRTGRFSHFIERHLLSIGVNLSHPIFPCLEKNWQKGHGKFFNGVIYVGFYAKKAVALEHLLKNLEKCHYQINAMAYADDQPRYVEEVNSLAEKNHLNFLGIIYGKAVNKRDFDLKTANLELANLEGLLRKKIVKNPYRHYFGLAQY